MDESKIYDPAMAVVRIKQIAEQMQSETAWARPTEEQFKNVCEMCWDIEGHLHEIYEWVSVKSQGIIYANREG